ncbi:MAG: hypothetical protein AAGG79_01780 [Pseudomonadota bacterium]
MLATRSKAVICKSTITAGIVAQCSSLHLKSGHPQFVAAKTVSLEYRGWPKAALIEDMSGTPSEAVELTRTEAPPPAFE